MTVYRVPLSKFAMTTVLRTTGSPSQDPARPVAAEELLETHDIAIPRDVPEWTEADTAYLDTVAGFDMMAGMLKQDYIKQQKIVIMSVVDFAWISRKERVYKYLWNHVLQIYQSLGPPGKRARRFTDRSKGEGSFVKDLSLERQEYMGQMKNDIEVLDIIYHLGNGYLKLKGWAIKPYAILGSKFEEAIFIDADSYFLRTPEVLFDDPGYLATGGLFFYDRAIIPGWRKGPEWIRTNITFMSNIPQASRSFRGTTSHEHKSGVVVIRRLPALISTPLVEQWTGKNTNNEDMRDLSFGYCMSGGGNQTNRELLIRNDEIKDNLPYKLALDSIDDLPPPEDHIDLVWDYMRDCMSGWKVGALPEDEAERVNSYVVLDKIPKRADSLIVQHKHVDPKGD
ncbi:hypothetical protein BKA57DRAFT_536783 [Linnemannia elongata]|nr:hypothetical protein BKA57DRAFT_536783 [Linnemannia elongata]